MCIRASPPLPASWYPKRKRARDALARHAAANVASSEEEPPSIFIVLDVVIVCFELVEEELHFAVFEECDDFLLAACSRDMRE